MRLLDKKVVVTGASGSIGQAIALGMAEEGADVVISYRSDSDGAQKTLAGIKQFGRAGHAIFADFTQSSTVEQFLNEAIRCLNGIDVLVNNAGIVDRSDFLNLDSSTFEKVLHTNLTIPLELMQVTAKHMIQNGRGGQFINISSIGATRWAPNRTAYSCSKAGMDMLTKCAAIELAQHGIRVNGIAPGVTESGMGVESARQEPAWLGKRTERIVLGRIGTPKDYVGAAVYLASVQSEWMTGQLITIDGGHSLLL